MLSNLNPETPPLPVIFGIEGEKLTAAEKKFFKEVNPTGFILFKRNCKDPKQLKKLTADLQKLLGREVPILIDQEGGRVQRMCPPEWKQYEPMESLQKRLDPIATHLLSCLCYSLTRSCWGMA